MLAIQRWVARRPICYLLFAICNSLTSWRANISPSKESQDAINPGWIELLPSHQVKGENSSRETKNQHRPNNVMTFNLTWPFFSKMVE